MAADGASLTDRPKRSTNEAAALTVTATAADGVQIDGTTVDGTAEVPSGCSLQFANDRVGFAGGADGSYGMVVMDNGARAAASRWVADQITQEIVERLSRELPAHRWRSALDRLATMWSGDEALLQAAPEFFDALRGLSLVTRTELGLAVVEPFRGVIELAHR